MVANIAIIIENLSFYHKKIKQKAIFSSFLATKRQTLRTIRTLPF